MLSNNSKSKLPDMNNKRKPKEIKPKPSKISQKKKKPTSKSSSLNYIPNKKISKNKKTNSNNKKLIFIINYDSYFLSINQKYFIVK